MSQMGRTISPGPTAGQEPAMYLQRPSTAMSQDVRHVLAKCFRSLYTRDTVRPETVKNLQVSKGGDDPYHERYVDSLQEVCTEWQRRMDEAAMLERHIMQAQARSMSADERELNRTKENCDNYPDLGLPPGRAHFRSCLDTELLKKHHLLTPEDYSTEVPDAVPPPHAPKVPAYARLTLTSQQRSQTRIESPFEDREHEEDSGEFPSFISDEDLETKGNSLNYDLEKFPRSDQWKEQMCEEQRDKDRQELAKQQAKTQYLRNSRFLSSSAPTGGRSLVKQHKRRPKEIGIEPTREDTMSEPVAIFLASPPQVIFRDYKVEQVYEMVLELKNISTVIRQCRALPPSTPYFSVGLGQYPGEHGLVAPGMSCKYPVRFVPDSLKDFDDEIVIQTQSSIPLVVPIRGRREPPILTLPPVLDAGHCLVGGYHVAQFFIKNEGGSGRFCIMSKSSWPATNFKSAVPEGKVILPPFDVRPSTFELLRGQSGIVEVIFNPHGPKVYTQDITISCDNCSVKHFVLKGEGQIAEVELELVERGETEPVLGEITDFSARHRIVFDELNPFTYTERNITVQNKTNVDLPFQWLTYKPHMNTPTVAPAATADAEHPDNVEKPPVNKPPRDRIPDLDSAFNVSPNNGSLPACKKMEFKVTFAPPMLSSFHSILHMVLQQVPRTSQSMRAIVSKSNVRTFTTSSRRKSLSDRSDNYPQAKSSKSSKSLNSTSSDKSSDSSGDDDGEVIIPIDGPIYCDSVGLEIEVKGKSVPINVVLHPYAIFIPGMNPIGTTIKKLFTMANHSFSTITFQWQPHSDHHIIEVEPPFGELDPGMAMDLELGLTGVEPGKINTILYCYVMNMDDPIALHIEAEMKGPNITIEEPDVNFGLVRLGQTIMKEITLCNQSQLTSKWKITDQPVHSSHDPMAPSDFSFFPGDGEIRPLEKQMIEVSFKPKHAHSVKRVFEIEVENGHKCSIAAYAEVQNPTVTLKESNILMPEVYVEVPCKTRAVLQNLGLLPTIFTVEQLMGDNSDECSLEISTTEGIIGPRQEVVIEMDFLALREGSFTDLRVPVTVEGMELPLVYSLSCEAKGLSVDFTVSEDSNIKSKELVLNFGEEVPLGSTPQRYLFIENKTAIVAPFTTQVQFLFARPPTPPQNQEELISKSRRSLLGRTPNLADPFSKSAKKAESDVHHAMLSQGNGAAFVVSPADGMLQAFSTQKLTITGYSDMWGTYIDKMSIKIGDMNIVDIPMSMSVQGCPLQFQMTASKMDQQSIVRFGTHVSRDRCDISGLRPIQHVMRVNNNSPHDIRVDWRVFNVDNENPKLLDLNVCFGRPFPWKDSKGKEIQPKKDEPLLLKPFPTDIIPNSPDTTPGPSRQVTWTQESEHSAEQDSNKVISLFMRPYTGKETTVPYDIIPNQLVVPARGHTQLLAQFTPLPPCQVSEAVDCLGFAVGYMSVDGKAAGDRKRIFRNEAFEASTIRLDMTAHVKPALLSIECTDDEGMVYRSAMSDLMKDGKVQSESLRVCSTMLSNNTETPLVFRLKVEEPFLLVELAPEATPKKTGRALQTDFHTLKPQHNLLVKVALLTTTKLLDIGGHQDDDEIPMTGRKLDIQDDLIIEFNNSTVQKIPLHATLSVPELHLSKQSLDFGTCLVGQERILEFSITNHTASHCHWTTIMESSSESGAANAFQLLPSSGMLEAHITHISNSNMLLRVHFTAKHAEHYEAVFLFKGFLGESVKKLYVRGQGSYDGKHEAVLNI